MRDFVILQRPNSVPERKGPFTAPEPIAAMVREVLKAEPDTACTVLEMAGGEPWPTHGEEWLSIYDTVFEPEDADERDVEDVEDAANLPVPGASP